MHLGIEGRVAIVTAASRGLGLATATALAEEGVRLIVSSRHQKALDGLAQVLPTECIGVAGDLADPTLPEALVAAAMTHFGRLDILVANTGGPQASSAQDLNRDVARAAFGLEVLGSMGLIQAALPIMQSSGWGRVVGIASGTVRQPMDGLALSNLLRPALWGWAKTLSAEVFKHGVTVNLVCPGVHATERVTALGRAVDRPMGRPEAFGRLVAFLCSEHTDFMTGTTVVVDGGQVRGL